MITVSSQWAKQSRRSGKIVLLAELSYGAGGSSDRIRLGTESVEFDTRPFAHESFTGLIKNIPELEQSVDLVSNKLTISQITLEIDNRPIYQGKRFSDLYGDNLGTGSDVGFDNRRAELRLWMPGIENFDNCFPLQIDGVIRDISPPRDIVTITIEDKIELRLNEFVDPLEDSDSYWLQGLPAESVGKQKPTIYGSNRKDITQYKEETPGRDLLAANWHKSHRLNMSKMVKLGTNRYWVAGHKAGSASYDNGDGVWTFDNTLGRWVELLDWAIVTNTAAGFIIQRTGDTFYDYMPAEEIQTGFDPTPAFPDFTDIDNIADGDITTPATAEFLSGDAIGTIKTITYKSVAYQIPYNSNQSLTSSRMFARFTTGLRPPFTVKGNTQLFQSGNSEDQFLVTLGDTSTLGVFFSVHVEKVATAGDTTFEVFEVFVRQEYEDTGEKDLYFGGQGYEYGSWINSRTQTETHADNNDQGEVIQNVAGGLESILRDLMSVPSGDIDLDSFNVLSNDIASLLFSSVLPNATDTKALIEDILTNFRSWLWWSTEGKFKVKAILDTYTAADMLINYNECIEFLPRKTPPTMLKTAVEVRYMWDGSAFKAKTEKASDTTAQTRYNVSELESTLYFPAKHIADKATAEAMRDFLLAFWKQPHHILTVRLPKAYLHIDIGDVIEFENVPWKIYGEDIEQNNTRAGQTIYKYWWVFRVRRGSEIEINAIQLHDLS